MIHHLITWFRRHPLGCSYCILCILFIVFWICTTLFIHIDFVQDNVSVVKLISMLLFLGMHYLERTCPDLFLSVPGQKFSAILYIALFAIMFFELAVHRVYYRDSTSR